MKDMILELKGANKSMFFNAQMEIAESLWTTFA
jgi:hypothetical protein